MDLNKTSDRNQLSAANHDGSTDLYALLNPEGDLKKRLQLEASSLKVQLMARNQMALLGVECSFRISTDELKNRLNELVILIEKS